MLSSREHKKMGLPRAKAQDQVTTFQYQTLLQQSVPYEEAETDKVQTPEVRLSEESFAQRLAEERARGAADAEARLQRDLNQKLVDERARVADSLRCFEKTCKEYFAKVEGEVVQLALTIARKILHREAQVDPLLVTALVQIALAQIKDGSAVTVRVRPEEAQRWREQLCSPAVDVAVTVIEDGECRVGDCLVETEMGNVNFNLETQLKEVERGFLDVLARTPQL